MTEVAASKERVKKNVSKRVLLVLKRNPFEKDIPY